MKKEIVTAAEIADAVFCEESARLRLIGTPTANQPQLSTGTAQHTAQAAAERVAGGSIAAGWGLLVIAALGILAWFLSRWVVS